MIRVLIRDVNVRVVRLEYDFGLQNIRRDLFVLSNRFTFCSNVSYRAFVSPKRRTRINIVTHPNFLCNRRCLIKTRSKRKRILVKIPRRYFRNTISSKKPDYHNAHNFSNMLLYFLGVARRTWRGRRSNHWLIWDYAVPRDNNTDIRWYPIPVRFTGTFVASVVISDMLRRRAVVESMKYKW